MTSAISIQGPPTSDPIYHGAEWSPDDESVEERMLALVYRVAAKVGYSRRASDRLCRQTFLGARSWSGRRPLMCTLLGGQDGTDSGRGTRTRYLAMLRTMMEPSVDHDRLERALDSAVLADEMALLPPPERFALRLAVLDHYTVRRIVERTGWTHRRVAHLLRKGLRTITAYRQPG